MSDRPQYEHDASKGETRYPPQDGEQFGGRPGEGDPHSRLNTPLSELDHLTRTTEPSAVTRNDALGKKAATQSRRSAIEDGEADEALRRAEDEAGGTIPRDH